MIGLLTLFLLTPGLPGGLGASPQPSGWVFATASQRSNYHDLGLALQQRLAGRGYALEVRATEGSYQNVEMLRSSGPDQADIALLQSDVAYLEHFQGRPYQAIASLNPELVHIVVSRGLGIRWASDLSRLDRDVLDVAVGEPGSGSAAHGLALLNELGISICSEDGKAQTRPCARIHGIPFTAAMERLVDRRIPGRVLARWGLRVTGRGGDTAGDGPIDVAFVTSTAPVQELSDLVEVGRGDSFTLLGVDWTVARRMRRHNPFFIITELPYLKYGVDDEDRRVLGTPTLLVVSNAVPSALVRALLEETYALAASPAAGKLSLLTGLDPSLGLRNVPIPIHPAAQAFHDEHRTPWTRWSQELTPYLLLALVVLLPLLVFHVFAGTAYRLQRRRLGRILGLLVYVWLVGSSFLYVFEGHRQSSFTPWGQSAIAVLHYLLSGLESKYPSTIGGIAVSIAILTVGVTVVALLTGEMARLFMERTLNVKRLRTKPFAFAERWGTSGPVARLASFLTLRDHVVLLGWSRRTERILQQLQSDDLVQRPEAVVVTADSASAETDDRAVARGSWVVEGDLASRKALERADVPTAKAVLLLAGETNGRGEALSVASALKLKALLGRGRSGPRLLVEARSPSVREHLECCDLPGEILDTRELGERLLCQSVLTPGIGAVYDELLSFGSGSQEIYVLPVPAHLGGLGLAEARDALSGSDALLLGARIDGETRWLPGESPRALGADGDRLLVLADSPRSLRPRFLDRFSFSRARRPAPGAATPDGECDMREPQVDGTETAPRGAERRTIRIGICGWDASSRRFVEELKRGELAESREFSIVVIDDIDEDRLVAVQDENGLRRIEPRDTEHLPEGVRFVIGDPTRRQVLSQAGISELDSLVILEKPGEPADGAASDHRALVISLTARALQPRVHIVVELVRPESREHFDGLGQIDLVCVDDLTEKLLAQAVVSEGISAIYSELLHATHGSNEIYVVPVPGHWIGRTFEEAYLHLAEAESQAILPIGYQVGGADGRAPVKVLNPPRKRQVVEEAERWRAHAFEDGDSLIVLADKEPSW